MLDDAQSQPLPGEFCEALRPSRRWLWGEQSVSALRWWESLQQIAMAALTGRKPASPGLLLKLAVAFCTSSASTTC